MEDVRRAGRRPTRSPSGRPKRGSSRSPGRNPTSGCRSRTRAPTGSRSSTTASRPGFAAIRAAACTPEPPPTSRRRARGDGRGQRRQLAAEHRAEVVEGAEERQRLSGRRRQPVGPRRDPRVPVADGAAGLPSAVEEPLLGDDARDGPGWAGASGGPGRRQRGSRRRRALGQAQRARPPSRAVTPGGVGAQLDARSRPGPSGPAAIAAATPVSQAAATTPAAGTRWPSRAGRGTPPGLTRSSSAPTPPAPRRAASRACARSARPRRAGAIPRSRMTSCAALRPGIPVTPPPGWVPAPVR